MQKIFVQIASYRDPECQWTVKDLFDKAAHPERIFVGICWQFDEEEDKHCFQEPYAFPDHIRTINFNPRDSLGSGWAHMQAQSLWKGEEYVLQIHAHMRFEQGWDETLIETLARCPSEKAALTTCLSSYDPEKGFPFRDEIRASFVFINEVKPQDPALITLLGALVDKSEPMAAPTHTPFWIGVFLFAKAEMIQAVPFDPFIEYYGEPIAYSARLFTHGWDLFEPDKIILYHWWGRNFELPRPYREMGTSRQKHSFMRVKHLLRFEAAKESAALYELTQYDLGTERSIQDFWLFNGVDLHAGTCTELAHKGRWNDAYSHYLTQKAESIPVLPRIFVQIASYRDPECQWTVKDLFEKAKYPDRIFVGICWQYDPEEDQDYFKVSTRPDQVRTSLFHWKESQGVCWARHQTQLLWNNEEYTLLIDSHMRFEFDWDERLIEDLAMCPSPKAALSNYPASYTPPHNLEANAKPTIQRPHPYDGGDIRFRGDNLDRLPERPLRGAFIAAGLLFAKSDLIREIPYDPHLYFNQEELSLAARLFTHGWDVYSMRQVLVYHLYTVTNPAIKKRPLHWEDHKKWTDTQERARKRMDHLMGYALSDDPTITQELDIYGLGEERTLEEYGAFCGIDFKNKHISEWALRAGYVENLSKYMDKKIFIPEIDKQREQEAEENALQALSTFPDPALVAVQPYAIFVLADNSKRSLRMDLSAPQNLLVLNDYLEVSLCKSLIRYAEKQNFSDSSKGVRAEIDGIAGSVLTVFNDIYCNRLSPFFKTNFEWYERPHFLYYAEGMGHTEVADAEQQIGDTWQRVVDRDYSVLLCLSDCEGGEIEFTHLKYRVQPRAGMLIAFPADNRYRHIGHGVSKGSHYALASFGTALGSKRTRALAPYASVFLRQKRI